MKTAKLLIVDDEKDIRNLMDEIFSEEGYQVETAANGVQAQQAWRKNLPDVIFLDVWMPDIDGISLLKEMQKEGVLEHTKVIMMSGHGTIETAIEATRLGAYDFLEKPLSLAKLIVTAERAIEHNRLHQENRQLKQKAPDQFLPIGKSKMVVQLRETIERLSKFTMPVLITGEAGVGKHHFARALHKTSHRKDAVIKEITSIDLNRLLEEERTEELKNLLRDAHQGTLVIANIEQLHSVSQDLVADLVLHQKVFLKGEPESLSLDIRVIALTRGELEEIVLHRQFRDDLFQRLKVMPIHVPALRQHTEDIPELIDYFVNYFVTREGLEYRHFSVPSQNSLRQYAWPGNMKELQNLIQRLLILGTEEVSDEEVKKAIMQSDLAQQNQPQIDTSLSLKDAKDQWEAAYLSQLLRETGGNVSETAKRSGVDRTNLYRKLKSLGIDPKNPV
ncbi:MULTISPECIES: sigma-54-dependent transcriptional regulator [Thiomicrorhabdus]|uniref:Sigma-54-dependent Fis family transcriptional regulator n=1 Tax=Thiomicrorhabdus heinhorstiae TaxID=2748010 RepID=A0ABS0BUL1_9GAMM|nr:MULTISPECIES: sigma-54 dependent transcriptional regulator [Thiomicrorhabdus]MBF6057525.1 sigma-54-dependent Fis family transcriptional regulator [Thiomicrorhabdus heinhorstiae]